MTKAKRYEGEALRAEAWHNMGRDKAWERKRAGVRELAAILCGKFELYCETKFDPMECGYLVITEVSKSDRTRVQRAATAQYEGVYCPFPGEIIFRHEEPALEFPSDHLKTKLLLIAG
jgi:hypothetical protein